MDFEGLVVILQCRIQLALPEADIRHIDQRAGLAQAISRLAVQLERTLIGSQRLI